MCSGSGRGRVGGVAKMVKSKIREEKRIARRDARILSRQLPAAANLNHVLWRHQNSICARGENLQVKEDTSAICWLHAHGQICENWMLFSMLQEISA